MSTTTRKKRITITAIVTAALVLGGGGAAFAYWTAQGTGTGTATTGDSTPFTVTSTTSGLALTPGGPGQTVSFTVRNPGTGSQYLTSVAVTVANLDGTPWTRVANCSASDYSITNVSVPNLQIASLGSFVGSATITMNNLNANQDGCKLASVPLYFSAS